MGQDVRRRFQKTVTYQANSPVSEDLGRGLVYRDIYLRLRGQPTVTDVNNTAAKLERGDAWACVTKIELLVNNQQVIRSITGNELWWLNLFMYGIPPQITPTLGDAATANPSFDVTLCLPMWMFRCIRPIDTALDSRVLSDLKIRITWGDYTSINADATGWTTNPYIDVHTLESANIKGPFTLQTIYGITKTVTATDPKFQIQLPVNEMYRGFLFNTTDAGVDQGDIINNIKLKSGTVVFQDVPYALVQGFDNLHRCGLHRTFDDAGGAYDDFQRSADSAIEGWGFLDLVSDGLLSEAIDTLGFSEFYLELDVTVGAGTTKINVLPIQLTPVRGSSK